MADYREMISDTVCDILTDAVSEITELVLQEVSDQHDTMKQRTASLAAVLGQISIMKIQANDAVNTASLVFAINLAQGVLRDTRERPLQ
jgi:hypothetical protein